MDLREIDCNYVDWINLVEDENQWRIFVNMGNNPSASKNDFEFCGCLNAISI
jgi:hypothetical protein